MAWLESMTQLHPIQVTVFGESTQGRREQR